MVTVFKVAKVNILKSRRI